jgi:alpha-tubulin suppressor-like RCC1 family protein
VDAAGQSLCWGYNEHGKLGDGTTTPKLVPTATLPFPVKQIALGEYHSCALDLSGKVFCFGLNNEGQLGDGTETERLVPTRVEGMSSPVELGVGGHISCALLADKTVSCWGTNAECTPEHDANPRPVGIANVKQLSVGYDHACAIIEDGTVSCWGNDVYGQVGSSEGAACTDEWGQTRRSPSRISGISDAIQVSAGYYQTCAVRQSGKISCWGLTQESLAQGQRESYAGPTELQGIDAAVKVSVGYFAACAILAEGSLACWGSFDQSENRIATPQIVQFPR